MKVQETWRGTRFHIYRLTDPLDHSPVEVFAEADQVEVKKEYKEDQVMVLDKEGILAAADALEDLDKDYIHDGDAPRAYYPGCQSLYQLKWVQELEAEEFVLVPKELFQSLIQGNRQTSD